MPLRLHLIRESEAARLFENPGTGSRMWIPKSICKSCVKFQKETGKPQVCEVDVPDWFLEKNPWPATQPKLL